MEKKQNNQQHKYVLLIEDDQSLQKACKMKFSEKGVDLLAVSDGQEMIDMLDRREIDSPEVVILDLLLPHISGFEILEKMRHTKDWEHIPVVVLTNIDQYTDEARLNDFKIKDYILKTDITLDHVVDKILGYLKHE